MKNSNNSFEDEKKNFLKSLFHKNTVHFAITSGNLQLLKHLIENGASFKDQYAVETAAKRGHLNIVKYLIEEKGMGTQADYLIDEKGLKIENVKLAHSFWYAAMEGHFDVMEYLFEKGVTTISDEAVTNVLDNGNPSSLEVVKYLVAKGAKIDDEALISAINHLPTSFDAVKYLVDEKGVKINNEAVFYAVREQNLDILKYLVEKGAKINDVTLTEESLSRYCLSEAASSGNIDIVKYLVDEINVYDGDTYESSDAALKAIKQDDFEVLKYLVEKFWLAWSSNKELTAEEWTSEHLQEATEMGNLKMVEYLVEKGSKISKETIREAKKNIKRLSFKVLYHRVKDVFEIKDLLEVVKFLEEEGASRCEALNIYKKYRLEDDYSCE